MNFSLVFQKYIVWTCYHRISHIILKFPFSFAVLLHTSCLSIVPLQSGLSLISSSWFLLTFSSVFTWCPHVSLYAFVDGRHDSSMLHSQVYTWSKLFLVTHSRVKWWNNASTHSKETWLTGLGSVEVDKKTVQDWAEYEQNTSSQMDLPQVLLSLSW